MRAHKQCSLLAVNAVHMADIEVELSLYCSSRHVLFLPRKHVCGEGRLPDKPKGRQRSYMVLFP